MVTSIESAFGIDKIKEELSSINNRINSIELPDVMTKQHVADFLGVCSKSATKYMDKAGSSRIDRRLYVRKQDLFRYLMSNRKMSEIELNQKAEQWKKN